jgi:hypothetical protein
MKWFGKSYNDFQVREIRREKNLLLNLFKIIEGDFFDEKFRSILKSGK